MKDLFIRLLFALFVLCCLNCFSQNTSPEFNQISKDSVLTANEKDIEFQKLLKKHKRENQLDFLIEDSFEITRWQWQQGWDWANKAIELCKKNLALMDSINYDNKSLFKRNIYGLGYYQFSNNNLNDALATFKKLLTYKKQDLYVLRGAYDIAEIYFITDQYHLSKDYYMLSQTIAEDQDDYDYIIKSALGIAQACKLINSPKSLREGVNTLIKVITKADSIKSNITIDNRYFHSLYNQLGNLYIDRLDYDFKNGKQNLEKALKIALELKDSELLNRTYNDLGVLYRKEEKMEAQFYFEKALAYVSNPFVESQVHRNLSKHHIHFGNYTKSFFHIQKSISLLVNLDTTDVKNLPSKLDLSNSDTKFQLISALVDKANIWIKLIEENPNKEEYQINVFNTLELADFLADETRIENTDKRSKLFWRKTASGIYLKATEVCYLLNDAEKAFYFIEKNKALLLLEDVTLKITKNNSNIPKTILEREQELKNNINDLEKRSIDTSANTTQSQLLLAKDDYKLYINSLDADYKFYFKTLQPAEVINFDTFKNEFLKDNNAYIEYIIHQDKDEEGYGLIITSSNTTLFEIKDTEELKNLVIEYRNLIDSPFNDKASIEHFKGVSYKIYKSLFPDQIEPLLKDKILTIVPDYYLQNIPFESLTTSNKNLNYLIYSNQINYSYSLSFLSENKKVIRKNTNNIIAFAPIKFPSKLTSLPHTKDELEFINSNFKAKTLLNEYATEDIFFKESNNHKIIHIASHANANDSISPWISFYDKKVNLEDIYSLKNSAELVVLSACNTSLGELHHGEGVMSLSRSFFNSGSHSVMPTLWEVNDKATLDIVKSFYTNLKQGQNKSLALHNAKLSYIEANSLSQSSPYYWASFVLIGDTRALKLESNFSIYYYYFIFGFIVLVVVILFLRRKK
ncbi:CHAT domain-containing protein [Winogradskyella sp. PE311]|uniref:CHAT domain-containing protein n=1 Tax=Winogradskyella sp. PE311 TaxID=3366943 RepID=UPI00397ECC8F